VLQATVSFRACKKIVCILNLTYPLDSESLAAPAPNTVQNWVLRLGLHELTRTKEQADDWVFFIDHTIQLGNEKCLIIVGIRLAVWQTLDRPLQLSDLSMILMEVVNTSNGEVVAEQIEKAADLVGKVAGVISDQGSDLTNGIARFQRKNEDVVGLTDMAHRTATALKHVLELDPQWTSFLAECGKTQPKAKQTELGPLLPPKLKVKARYMNLHSLIGWAHRMLRLLDTPSEQRPVQERLDRLDSKFGWLLEYRESIENWARLMSMVDVTLTHSREVGFSSDSPKRLAKKLSCHVDGPQSVKFRDEVVSAMESNCSLLPEGANFPASSEILESLIGKGKQIGRQHSRSGFTRNILTMAASVVDISIDTIRESFAAVKTKTLNDWVKESLGTTMNAFRRTVLPSKRNQNGLNLLS
jgi:hypothetical protein